MAYSFSYDDVRGCAVITLKNIRPGTIPEDIADFLWKELGLNVSPENISQSDHSLDPWATVVLTRECLADWLNKAFTTHGLRLLGAVPRADASRFGLPQTGRRKA